MKVHLDLELELNEVDDVGKLINMLKRKSFPIPVKILDYRYKPSP